MANLPVIQTAPNDAPPQTKAALNAIANVVNKLVSNTADGVVTKRELASTGLVSFGAGGIVSTNNQAATPNTITGLTVTGGFSSLFIKWNQVTQEGYSHTEIWRSQVDDISTAIFTATTIGAFYADIPQDNSISVTYFYWVRAVNSNGLHGRFNDTVGTSGSTANDPAYALQILSGEITNTQLHQDLNSRIALVDTSGIGLKKLQAITSQQDKVAADSLLANSVTLHQRQDAHFANLGNIAQITNTATQTLTDLQAEVTARTLLEVKLDAATALYSTSSTASVDAFQALVDSQSTLQAQIDSNTGVIDNLDSIIATPVAAEATKRENLQTAILGNTLDPTGQTLSSLSAGMLFEEKASRISAVDSINTVIATIQGSVNTAGSISNAVNQSKQEANAYADSAVASSATTLRGEFTTADDAANGRLDTITADVNNLSFAQADATGAVTKEIKTAISEFRREVAPNAEGILLAALGLYNGSATDFQSKASIQTVETTIADETQARADSVTTLQAELNGNTAAIQTQQTVTNGLSAQYTIKTDVNGKIAGFGLANTGNDAPSLFEINADRFVVSSGAVDAPSTIPFVVDATTGVTHIDAASIKDGTITTAHIGSLDAGTIDTGTLTGVTIEGNTIRSTGVTSLDVGIGLFSDATGRLRVGDPNGNHIKWDGSALNVYGNIDLATSNFIKSSLKSSLTSGSGFYISGDGKMSVGDNRNFMEWDGADLKIAGNLIPVLIANSSISYFSSNLVRAGSNYDITLASYIVDYNGHFLPNFNYTFAKVIAQVSGTAYIYCTPSISSAGGVFTGDIYINGSHINTTITGWTWNTGVVTLNAGDILTFEGSHDAGTTFYRLLTMSIQIRAVSDIVETAAVAL